jgi:hypothetical protein
VGPRVAIPVDIAYPRGAARLDDPERREAGLFKPVPDRVCILDGTFVPVKLVNVRKLVEIQV